MLPFNQSIPWPDGRWGNMSAASRHANMPVLCTGMLPLNAGKRRSKAHPILHSKLTSYKEAKNKNSTTWKVANNRYNPQTNHIKRVDRNSQTTPFCLLTGHCGLRESTWWGWDSGIAPTVNVAQRSKHQLSTFFRTVHTSKQRGYTSLASRHRCQDQPHL